ncbi:ead/Ea22-like family protein [Pseudomonas aeruginosa]|uniref:ead/Ea22-like family protein n=1 Tax=Pseudomonas aeruginosa TaxID=287 RepID=UPI003A4E4FC8
MDEPLFNELLESVKQADQIMSDRAELRRLAEEVIRIERNEDEPISAAWDLFDSAANPQAILALLDEIDRLKAENEELRGALQAVVDDPTWRSNDNTLWPKIIKAMDKGAKQ